MSDEYDSVARGKLKLKTDSGKVSKKLKKSKKHKKDDRMENPSREKDSNAYSYEERVPKVAERQLTKAEMSFKKMQVKMVSLIHLFALISHKRTNDEHVAFVLVMFYAARETDYGKSSDDTQAARREIQ